VNPSRRTSGHGCVGIRNRGAVRCTVSRIASKIRLTQVIMDVLDVLAASPPDDPAWGLRLCEATGHGSGTTYPALNRLLKVGLIEDRWEDPPPEDRPRRRFYEITSTGRQMYADALRERENRRAAWLRPAPQTGSAT
jgi:PadR family transcriptional regulator